jgi:hypothetical protein
MDGWMDRSLSCGLICYLHRNHIIDKYFCIELPTCELKLNLVEDSLAFCRMLHSLEPT